MSGVGATIGVPIMASGVTMSTGNTIATSRKKKSWAKDIENLLLLDDKLTSQLNTDVSSFVSKKEMRSYRL